MILEFLESLATPCPRAARRSGLLREAVAIRARHARCRAAWRGHLDICREEILAAAQAAPGRDTAQAGHGRDTVVILGSGALLDVPVEELAALFGRVVLVDMVHPLSARLRVRALPNVRLEHLDLTGLLDALLRAPACPPPEPDAGLERLLRALRPDLTVSCMVLSQLGLAPLALQRRAGVPRQDRLDLGRAIVARHLETLRALPAGVLLLTDTQALRPEGVKDLLLGVAPPPARRQWIWDIAPRGELDRRADIRHQVRSCLLGALSPA